MSIVKRYTSPTLPLPPVEYAQTYGNELIKVLRLYFNNNDATVNAVIELLNNGGYFPSLNAGTVTADQFTGGNFTGDQAQFIQALVQVLQGNIQGGDGVFNNLTGVNVNASLFTGAGQQINYPHISAADNSDQYADDDNEPTIVKWDTLEVGRGFILNMNSTATAEYSGVYKIDYSLQFANNANSPHDVYVWLQVNGNDVPDSSSKFTVPTRKSSNVASHIVAYSHITFEVQAGESIGLWWATDLAADPLIPKEGVWMEFEAAQTSPPYDRPANPSAIGSIVYVSAPVPALTQITPIGVLASGLVNDVSIVAQNNT